MLRESTFVEHPVRTNNSSAKKSEIKTAYDSFCVIETVLAY
jgi:hypothetical protein|uniref:Uncharacterized protein n=1 Tax=Picea glauca TaxID=3330 RepID=A0A101LW70_PICGL|nr:hypothetical protein ABT39_MTgene1566 [Picea glauca]